MDDKNVENYPNENADQVSRKRSFLSVFLLIALSQCAQGKTYSDDGRSNFVIDSKRPEAIEQHIAGDVLLWDDDDDTVPLPSKGHGAKPEKIIRRPQSAKSTTDRAGSATTSCIVADPTGTPLNVRISPDGRIVHTLSNGEVVQVDRDVNVDGNSWSRIKGNIDGFVVSKYLNCVIDQSKSKNGQSQNATTPARSSVSKSGLTHMSCDTITSDSQGTKTANRFSLTLDLAHRKWSQYDGRNFFDMCKVEGTSITLMCYQDNNVSDTSHIDMSTGNYYSLEQFGTHVYPESGSCKEKN